MDTAKKFVVTINKEIGSGGRTIGETLAKRLGVKFYDKALVRELTSKFNLSTEELEAAKAKKRNRLADFTATYHNRYLIDAPKRTNAYVPTSENIFRVESDFLKHIASDESCVIAGRSGFFVFRDEPNALRIMIYSSLDKRVQHVMAKNGVTEAEARDIIASVDKGREAYTKRFSGTSRYDVRNYDLVLNVANMTVDEAVDVIMAYINK